MDPSFWLENWERGQTGFHLPGVNPVLLRHWEDLGLKSAKSVLVPLCGKSVDLSYLRTLGHQVMGLELSPIAVKEFWTAMAVTPKRHKERGLVFWESDGIEIIEGDFFEIRPEDVESPSVVYDRAALIAMPVELQFRYADHLMHLAQGAPIFLVTFDYKPSEMAGPPFPVSRIRLGELFDDHYEIALIESRDALDDNAGLAARGLKRLSESVWLLSPKLIS